MADILGNQLCMESLQTDIQDVQWTINDISSRVGPLDVPSWKFPDKLSWETDIEQLLDMYSFSEDEKEENQVAHIALYELLIDRLVLLVQGTAVYVNQVQQVGKSSTTTAAPPSSTSVGLSVKHFWSQMTNLQTLMQQLYSQNKISTKKVADLEKSLKKVSPENNLNISSSTINKQSESPVPSNIGSPPKVISCDESNKGSQTQETAFVPCEACDVVQKKMRESGDLVIDACQKQALPSSLRKYRPQISHVKWLSYNDVCRWMAEQNKDLQRLCKHIEQMEATINPLKAEVTAFEKETKRAENRAKQCEVDLQLEKETQAAVKRQFEVKLEEKEKQHELSLADLHRQKEELMRKHTLLATELDERKLHSTELEGKLKQWETKGQQLEKDLEERTGEVRRLSGTEAENQDLRKQLTETQTQLQLTTKTLAKEQGKNKSAAQHKQQVQAKQESLSERVVTLGQENEELRDAVSELEEEKQQLEDSLQETKLLTTQLQTEKKQQEVIIRNLKEEKSVLEQSIADTERQIAEMENKLTEAKERERLIIEYPDLNGPVNPDLHGTGDIMRDMENQVKANVTRIQVLEEQNEGLRRSITKIMVRNHATPTPAAAQPPKNTAPVPLWQTGRSNNTSSHQAPDPPPYQQPTTTPYRPPPPPTMPVHTPPARQQPGVTAQKPATSSASDFFTVGKAPADKPRDHRKPPPSGGRGGSGGSGGGGRGSVFVPVNATSIGAYKQIKKSMGDTVSNHQPAVKGKRPTSGHSVSVTPPQSGMGGRGGEDYEVPVYVCEHCDKMYAKARDLEIHRSYCTA